MIQKESGTIAQKREVLSKTHKKYPADFLAKAEFAQSMWLDFNITFRTGS